MTQLYFPFNSGAGANVSQWQWGQMGQHWLDTGVLDQVYNQLLVYADSTGMQVKVKSGAAWVQGFYFSSDAETVLPISPADTTNPRIDRVVVRVDWTNNIISLNVINGTPASSPAAPAVTQNSNIFEISLCQVYVTANVTTIGATNITDERVFADYPSCSIVKSDGSTQQTFTDSVITKCTLLNTKVIDINKEFSSNRYTAKKWGMYYFRAWIDWGLSSDPTNSSAIYLYVNGANYNSAVTVANPNTRYVQGSCLVQLNAGDYVELYIYQDSGGASKNLINARFEIARL